MELEADAEHQQHDADLGELLGEANIGDEAGRVGTDENAADEIADDRRQAEALRQQPKNERRREAAGQGRNEVEAVHRAILSDDRASAQGTRHARSVIPAGIRE